MDLNFFRMIKSFAEAEREPHFRSKKYHIVYKSTTSSIDAGVERAEERGSAVGGEQNAASSSARESIVLKHPDNVLVVASPTGEAPPPVPGERRFSKLSQAVFYSFSLARSGVLGCSIVVHPGMYINPMHMLSSAPEPEQFKLPRGFSLEIVGVEEVRIVNTEADKFVFWACSFTHLTLRNLLIHDLCSTEATVFAVRAKVSLIDVLISGKNESTRAGINAFKRSEVDVSRSTFIRVHHPFYIRHSDSKFTHCQFHDVGRPGLVDMESSFSIMDSEIIGVGTTVMFARGFAKVDIRRCRFFARKDGGFSPRSIYHAILANSGVQMTVTDCSLVGFTFAFSVQDFHSKAEIRDCEFIDCGFALVSHMNPTVVVEDCKLSVCAVAEMSFCVRGRILFRRNSVKIGRYPELLDLRRSPREAVLYPDSFRQNRRNAALFFADRQLETLEDDFPRPIIQFFDPDSLPIFGYGATRESRLNLQERLALTIKSINETQTKAERSESIALEEYKYCVYCCLTPTDDPSVSFKYCNLCRGVCYCSKACQVAHWKDHKLICKKPTSG